AGTRRKASSTVAGAPSKLSASSSQGGAATGSPGSSAAGAGRDASLAYGSRQGARLKTVTTTDQLARFAKTSHRELRGEC
ncbi:MAG: hypothetical protein ACK5XN_33270, partial [Bacteroidota bacterium]